MGHFLLNGKQTSRKVTQRQSKLLETFLRYWTFCNRKQRQIVSCLNRIGELQGYEKRVTLSTSECREAVKNCWHQTREFWCWRKILIDTICTKMCHFQVPVTGMLFLILLLLHTHGSKGEMLIYGVILMLKFRCRIRNTKLQHHFELLFCLVAFHT